MHQLEEFTTGVDRGNGRQRQALWMDLVESGRDQFVTDFDCSVIIDVVNLEVPAAGPFEHGLNP